MQICAMIVSSPNINIYDISYIETIIGLMTLNYICACKFVCRYVSVGIWPL